MPPLGNLIPDTPYRQVAGALNFHRINVSSSVRGGLSAKPLSRWTSAQALSLEEQSALDQARGLQDK